MQSKRKLWFGIVSRTHNYQSLANTIHDIFLCNNIQKIINKQAAVITLPMRMREKLCKNHPNGRKFKLTRALAVLNVRSEEFKKCWKIVHRMIPDDEYFSLFEKVLHPQDGVTRRVDFIKEIFRRSKAMKKPVAWYCFLLLLCGVLVLLLYCVDTQRWWWYEVPYYVLPTLA